MTFEDIDARYRAAALSGDSEQWDDPEREAAEDGDGADKEATYDEALEEEA